MRTWLHQRLISDQDIVDALPGGIYAFSSFTDVPKEKPFAVHKAGLSTAALRDGGDAISARSPFSVWVHDHPTGDYLRIDSALSLIHANLEAAVGEPGNQLIKCEWLETSEDFVDEKMGTILRFARFRITHTL